MSALQLPALRCGNLQTELSRAMSHTGTILLCIIYSLAQYYALAFFTFTGLINMIHDFDIGVIKCRCSVIASDAESETYVNVGIIGCACFCMCLC